MSRMGLMKGKAAEREVVNILKPIIAEEYALRGLPPVDIKRNLSQTQNGGYDIEGVDWLALEVKRQEQLNLNGWWEQAVRQTKKGQTTVLIYRQNNCKWRVQMLGMLSSETFEVRARVDIDLPSFLTFFRHRIKEELDCSLGLPV